MKKLLLIFILLLVPNFIQGQVFSANTSYNKSFNRFGMNILALQLPVTGFDINVFPLSFYFANRQGELISWGFDFGINYVPSAFPNLGLIASEDVSVAYQAGMHLGYGRMYKSAKYRGLDVGYLLEFGIGYTTHSFTEIPVYFSFSPNFVLEINQFIYRFGVIANTSANFSVSTSFGFLLN